MAKRAVKTTRVALRVRVNGALLQKGYVFTEARIVHAINEIPLAELTLTESSGAATSPKAMLPQFAPGAGITIDSAGRGNTRLFSGVVTRVGIATTGRGETKVRVSCADKAIKLTRVRNSSRFLNMRDSDVFERIVRDAGLDPVVDSTPVEHETLVQYDATDWDFLLARARAVGQLVFVRDGEIRFSSPRVSGRRALTVTLGKTLLSFEGEMDGPSQVADAAATSWDAETQRPARRDAREPAVNRQGRMTGAAMASALQMPNVELHTSASVENAGLAAWSRAELLFSRLARLQGVATLAGTTQVTPGDLLGLNGVGAAFDGSAYVRSVTHRITTSSWQTEAGFGLPDPVRQNAEAVMPARQAGGLLPHVGGLQVAKVVGLEFDSGEEPVVYVELPSLPGEQQPLPARMSSFFASSAGRAVFYPEIDDEVIVGFLNQDPRNPVILGSLFNSQSSPPDAQDSRNDVRTIRSRSGMVLEFNDRDGATRLSTANGEEVVLDERKRSISVTDSHGNGLAMNRSGITMESPGNIKIKAGKELALEAGKQIQADAAKIRASAQVSMDLNGAASTTIKSGGVLTHKAPLIKLN